MDLAGAMGLTDREHVAFVGAGGKKTAMARLVAEGAKRGLAVGYTTTVHVPPPEYPLVLSDPDHLVARLRRPNPPLAFARERILEPERVDRKVRGFDPTDVDEVWAAEVFDWLLVKADGARQREFKAPGIGEPPIPRRITVVVAVASAWAIGSPLTDDVVHRPEQVRAITGLQPGAILTPDAMGSVLASEQGGLKGVPDGAAVLPLVNKADTTALRESATATLEAAFRRTDRFHRGIVASLEGEALEVVEAG